MDKTSQSSVRESPTTDRAGRSSSRAIADRSSARGWFASAKPRQKPSADQEAATQYVTVKEFEPLRATGKGRLTVKVIESPAGRALDIREFATTPSFAGPTKRGVRLYPAEWEALLAQADAIREALGSQPQSVVASSLVRSRRRRQR